MKAKFLYNINILRILACVMGYSLWAIISASHIITHDVAARISYYNAPEQMNIYIPTSVNLTLNGPRTLLRQLHHQGITLHIDAAHLHEGVNHLPLAATTIFLPPAVRIMNTTPLIISVEVTKQG